MTRYYIPGSDERWELLAGMLREKGEVFREGAPGAGEEAAVILPYKKTQEEITASLLSYPEKTRVFVWTAGEEARLIAKKRGIFLYALGDDRILRAQNARATAEGCLASVLETRDRTLFGESVLVCGFGHCGSAIARLFWLCGCEVTVFARERGRRLAEAEGFSTISTLATRRVSEAGLVINTVPAPLFVFPAAEYLAAGCFVYQVASGACGLDEAFCREKGIRLVPLPALPARFSPRSEAEVLEEYILERCGEVPPWQ